MNTLAMEEHFQAYFAWKDLGFQDCWCWHVDAHLDIGKTGLSEPRLKRLIECANAEQARAAGLLGNSYLPWGGLHCGNYLYPAVREGILNRLTWVIPPDLPVGSLLDWAIAHVNGWFELELAEYSSFRLEGERVVGQLLGIPFELGVLDSLVLPREPVLLDIDIDYFLTEEGDLWSEAEPFQESIASIPVLFQTVAYSVMGGFTPQALRRIARPFLDSGESTEGYQGTALDRLAYLVRCRRHQEALDLTLPELEAYPLETGYLRGTSLQALGRHLEAVEAWQDLLLHPGLCDDGRSYLHGICSESWSTLKRPELALEHALAGLALEPDDYRHLWNETVARENLGDLRKAVKLLRRVVRLTEHLLFGLKARYALARVYKHQGKDGLARLELQKLAQLDVTGRFRAVTMLA